MDYNHICNSNMPASKPNIAKEEITKQSRQEIEGKFYLSNGDIAEFVIDLESGWEQWGSAKENLWVTVDRLDELQKKLIESTLSFE